MFIPLRALCVCSLVSPVEESARFGGVLCVERDSNGCPWLIVTDGRIIVCVSWEDADGHEALKAVKVHAQLAPALCGQPGFRCLLPARAAGRLARDASKGSRRGLRPFYVGPHSVACLFLPETGLPPALYARTELDGLMVLEPGKTFQPRFVDYRAILDAPPPVPASGVTRLPSFGCAVLGPLLHTLDVMGLDAVRLDMVPGLGGKEAAPVRFQARSANSHETLVAVGMIMPLDTGPLVVRGPAPLKTPAGTAAQEKAACPQPT